MDRGGLFKFLLVSLVIYVSISSCTKNAGSLSATDVNVSNRTMVRSVPKDVLFHYWDNYDFKDTVALKNPAIGEQALVNFIAAFSKVSDTIRSAAVKHMLSLTKGYPTSFRFFTQQYEHYLYDPNSPIRNDLYYKPVLEYLIDSCQLKDIDRLKYSALLKLVIKNSVGTKAQNFKFQLPQGGTGTLYGINVPFTLLFFYEPGCPHCETTIDNLKNTPGFLQLIKNGKLNVLAIYASGGSSIWKAYQSHIPDAWTNGLDKNRQILSQGLYEIRASPTLYLLDKEKTVLLKDTDLSQVASFFNAKT